MHNVVFHETIVPHNQLCSQIKTGINCGRESRIMAELRRTRESSFSECDVESSRKRILIQALILPLAKCCKAKDRTITNKSRDLHGAPMLNPGIPELVK